MPVTRVRRPPKPPSRAVGFLLAAYLVPTVILGKWWASIGFSPFYLPDLCVIAAGLLALPAIPSLLHQNRPLRHYATLVAILSIFVAQGVVRGQGAGYPAALKYADMAVYPLASVAAAAWLMWHPETLPSLARPLAWVPVGLLALTVAGASIIPASYGLYCAVALCTAVTPGLPGRRLLFYSGLTGFLILAAQSGERTVLITVALSVAATVAAAHGTLRRRPAKKLVAYTTLTAGALLLAALFVAPTRWPIVGAGLSRLAQSFSSTSSQASNNVAIRQAFWSYALHVTNGQPLLGGGAGHYVDVTFLTNDVSQTNTGVHNSFVGYAFYYGYVAGLLVVVLFGWALARAWRLRRTHPYAPALFGCVVAAAVTASTNVALESPYIAGVSWFAVAAVMALPDPKAPR